MFNSTAITTMLREVGVEAISVSRSKLLLSLLQSRVRPDARTIDLVLLDEELAEMDGIETAMQIRSLCERRGLPPETRPFVSLMTSSQVDLREISHHELQQVGIDSLVRQPIFRAAIIRLLRSINIQHS
mmetsp:Transcript_27384/g.32109  ORF Transcript_27384/g.32109 Transcript_27384/m.32109 type:complete len:129 (+) Transcript_27384:995-1381(+)